MKEADARIRTADPFITSEVLYQLSYVGKVAILGGSRGSSPMYLPLSGANRGRRVRIRAVSSSGRHLERPREV